MVKLNYILIGFLPEWEQKILVKNLMKNKQNGQDFSFSVFREDENGFAAWLHNYPAQESLLVSGQTSQLRQAAALDMAALGYVGCDGGQPDMWAEGLEEVDYRFLDRVYRRHHGLPWTILETRRCVVKEFSLDYLEELFELYAGEGMTAYIEPLYPYEKEREYQKAYIENMYRFYGYGMWIVCEKETGKLIGRAGVENREELGGELELGYAIGTPFWRRGYATEVCRAILSYVREELECDRINCLIEEGNTVSERLAEKLGFAFQECMLLDGKRMKRYVRTFDCV